jgi:hypothetical protein
MLVELVTIDWLKPHEEIRPKKVAELQKMTLRWSGYTKPLLVDRNSGAILDGHHRYTVGLQLELVRLPVILVDYLEDDSIELDLWPASELSKISKQQVIDMSNSDDLFPAKTTRHRFGDTLPPIAVSLTDLGYSN